jgi:hypothetical protein
MDCCIPKDLFNSLPTVIVTRLAALMTYDLQLVLLSSLAQTLSLGVLKSKLLSLEVVLKQSTGPLQSLLQRFIG